MKWLFNMFRRADGDHEDEGQEVPRPAGPAIDDSDIGSGFPEDADSLFSALAPYVAARRPLDFFFEMYAVNVLELLPARTLEALDDFSKRYPDFFQKHDGDWQRYVVKELHLSDTIEVALWDLWIANSETLRARGEIYEPWDYAHDFLEQYLADDSQVDVWTDESLDAAKRRIARYRADKAHSRS